MTTKEQLKEAELILKAIFEDKKITSRNYLIALTQTYFNNKKLRGIK